MKLKAKITIADYFFEIDDPRVETGASCRLDFEIQASGASAKQHKLIDIITIAICAVICGADTWVDIETYGRAKYDWLKKFL